MTLKYKFPFKTRYSFLSTYQITIDITFMRNNNDKVRATGDRRKIIAGVLNTSNELLRNPGISVLPVLIDYASFLLPP